MSLHHSPNIRRLACSKSGRELPAGWSSTPVGLCTCCPPPGKPIVVEYDLEAARPDVAALFAGRQVPPGLAAWSALLPVHGLPGDYAADVGGTPIVPHGRLGAELGVELLIKNEGMNPSGSFKDRGLAVGIAFGRALGAQRFCLPTQGNAGVAACLFSSRLGLPGCLVYMPEAWHDSVYHRSCELFAGEVRFCGANIAAAGKKMREDVKDELARGEFVDISTFFEPGRLEGKKTMGLEIARELGPDALPEFIVYPTGGGTGLVGIWKAFAELRALGIIPESAPLPRMIAVQSANCAPLVASFERGLDEVEPVTSRGTVADGLDVPGAIMGHAMLRVLRESRGGVVAVPEEAIVDAFRRFGALGITAGYESAATLAAARTLRASGAIPAGARVLLLLTGSHLIPVSKRA